MADSSLYPELHVDKMKNPSRFYAIPILGFFVKCLMVIPVVIELYFLKLVVFIFSILNSFAIFSSGKYWKSAYDFNLGVMRLETNLAFFLWGLTDRYPGFALDNMKGVSLDIAYPKKPSKLFATPLLGVLIRLVLMIPYVIYSHVVTLAATIAIFVSWLPVLTSGKYPETTFEIARDATRIERAISAYLLGLSDTYPSFWISMKHQGLKMLLLVIATILTLFSFNTRWSMPKQQPLKHPMEIHHTAASPQTYRY